MLGIRSPAGRPRSSPSVRIAVFRGVVPCVVALVATPVSAQSARPSTEARVLTLRDILDSALAHHPLAEAAQVRVRAARGARTTARALGNPVLSYDVENASFPRGSPVPGMDRETMMTATLPLATIMQRGPRARQADADVRVAEADASRARQQLALDAARAYFRTALAQVSVDAAHDLTAWLDSVVAYNRTRVEQGATAEADLIRTELERDRAAADATLQEAELARDRAELASFLGTPSRSTVVVAIDDLPLAMPEAADARTTRSAMEMSGDVTRGDLSRRPDVRAARERLLAADASIATERSSILRALDATFGAKRTAGTTSMVAGLSMPLPIFDPNRGQIARAAAERDVAALQLVAEERMARADLSGAYEAASLLTDRASLLARGTAGRPPFLARADEARRIALGAYREGAVSLLQVIDAARAWGEARLTFYHTLYAQHESVAMLVAARGDDLLTTLPSLATRGPANPR